MIQIKNNKVIKGDCLEQLDVLPKDSVDLVVTDPPYGIEYQSKHRDDKFDVLENDDVIDTSFIPKIERNTKPNSAIYVFTRWDVYPEWLEAVKDSEFEVKNCIVWDKKRHGMGDLKESYGPQHEFIIYATKGTVELNGKRPSDIISEERLNELDLEHPTEKPVSLIAKLIKNSSDKGDLVLDPFAGSGSTLVAAEKFGRNYIGIEIAEKFVRLARQRLKDSKSQKRITDLENL